MLLSVIMWLSSCVSQPSDKLLMDKGLFVGHENYYEQSHLDELFGKERGKAGKTVRPNIGLALAGGGTKASGFAIGVLQGLHVWGLMQHVDVLSTVSGGSYAGYWYYSRLVRDTGDAFQAPGPFDSRLLLGFFADCLPARYQAVLPSGPVLAALEPCPKRNYTNYLPDVPTPGIGFMVMGNQDRYRYQNYLRGYQDLFSTGRNMFGAHAFNYFSTDDDDSINNEFVENSLLLVGASLINVVPNLLFDWEWNVSSTQRAYARGIARTYGASPPLCEKGGCFKPLFWKGEIRREGDIRIARALGFEDIKQAYERKGAPLWIINSTAGEDRSVFDNGKQSDVRFTAFEFTPYGFGSGLYDYHLGKLEGISLTEAVVTSAAFFDDQQKGELSQPGRSLAAAGMKLSTLNWGTSYRNPKNLDSSYWMHMALPFPLYYLDRLKNPDKSTYIHLSDGGQSENLGAYALIRRGLPNIIISDHAGDRSGAMQDICRLKTQLDEHKLSLRLPGLEGLKRHCEQAKDQAWGYDVYNWRHPVLLGCIVADQEEGDSCVEPTPTERAKGKYFARLFVIKPSLGNDALAHALQAIAGACFGGKGECADRVLAACTDDYSASPSPLWRNAAPASCELYGFIWKNGPGTSGMAADRCPQFPQYGTVAMTVDSSPWMYGAMRDLAAYYAQRVAALFDAQGRVDTQLFEAELRYQTATKIGREPVRGGSWLFQPKAGNAGRCYGLEA